MYPWNRSAVSNTVTPTTLAFPFKFSGPNFATTNVYHELVRGQIIDCVMTNDYERVMRPSYGANIRDLLFDPTDALVRFDAASAIQARLEAQVPRANIDSVELTVDASSPNIVNVNVHYSTKYLTENLVIPVSLSSDGNNG